MTISGCQCLACGLVHAPIQGFGCERCGASGDQLVPRDLPAAGTIVSRAVVHVHRYPTPKVPFTVLEIALDAGPVIRALAAESEIGAYAPGAQVTGGATDEDGLVRFILANGMDVR